ncbi:MAG: endonuclease/exonuclease/phosphatase family protein [Pirellulaceae bacterium]
MRILTWNVQHGGRQQEAMASAIAELEADTAVLTEFRASPKGALLIDSLRARGLVHAEYDRASDGTNGVLIASRLPIRLLPLEGPAHIRHRWLHFQLDGCDVDFLGVYLHGGETGDETRAEKQCFWDGILAFAGRLTDTPAMLLGDLNTGKHYVDEEEATFICADSFEKLTSIGWTDLPRAFHGDAPMPTWWSRVRGFRLDHSFASTPLVPRVTAAEYFSRTESHVLNHPVKRPWPAELGKALSDHAALVVEFS